MKYLYNTFTKGKINIEFFYVLNRLWCFVRHTIDGALLKKNEHQNSDTLKEIFLLCYHQFINYYVVGLLAAWLNVNRIVAQNVFAHQALLKRELLYIYSAAQL